MSVLSRSITRTAVLSTLVFVLCAIVLFSADSRDHQRAHHGRQSHRHAVSSAKSSQAEKALERMDLTEAQCNNAFPSLNIPIQDSVARGKFVFNVSDPEYKGLVQGRIRNNQLYVLSVAPDTVPDILHQRTAILQQIHRALLTAPERVPDTHFAFVINDSPKNNSWTFARENKNSSSYNTWLMPHFGFWSWERDGLGTMDDIMQRIDDIERVRVWDEKLAKPVWRGTVWFNPLAYPNLRKDLVKQAGGKAWANVQALRKSSAGDNGLKIEDFCKHKYVVYTEGVTYSGRLPYHQACESVLLTAPLTYLTTTAYWIKPINADVLFSSFGYREASRAKPNVVPLLPTVKDWREANAIYIAPDSSNLESTIALLEKNPDVAKRIARSQRSTAVERGFLRPAAEVCYWRALIRGWASVAEIEGGGWGEDVGERFETWIVKQVVASQESGRGRTRWDSKHTKGTQLVS
ncbi:hypothetical protein BU24DRAFT_462549 [Aaosphaeria arxii CBS 175.79]|uniref:Glycosyl transferase CAP10 domain-containing protein n=1 Tax=Aaosphaeria arxii CBS 175.79 TaxID=1450172 RepID=A0A6A5XUT3_9PLEO|nr:uncharacterized protein BU24DRAFT_462549 [Aaosphaeria arxii CBS 175.79]KAF2016390.1 hypothetical protein BU24DRAFT_462549 [Aaosphaeria arxii CBS 175.79]